MTGMALNVLIQQKHKLVYFQKLRCNKKHLSAKSNEDIYFKTTVSLVCVFPCIMSADKIQSTISAKQH
jgi:hypothetical protein